ncbi:hypothetical protein AB0I84_14800 [Streptomyces spectabilis]|uniref:hypothetical protein n=1 Tax=Streptomyces spectabilis TaxID=68270 RepID=UPI0033C61FEF
MKEPAVKSLHHSAWELISAPMTPEQACQSAIHGRVAHEITNHHDIQLAVAPRLIRPMLYDLARSGLWSQHRCGHYRLDSGDCHVFSWNTTGRVVQHYTAGHSDHICLSPRPPYETNAWLPHFDGALTLPAPGTAHGWRGVLHRATALPITFLPPALAFYGRYHFGITKITHSNFAVIFHAMADEAADIHERMLNTPGHHFIRDRNGLIWNLATTPEDPHSTKPAVTGIYPPRGEPADRPTHQRANQAPDSSTLATRQRPASDPTRPHGPR